MLKVITNNNFTFSSEYTYADKLKDTPVLREWIRLLRSGTYRQTINQLRDDADRYCCLGVLCELTMPSKWARSKGCSWEHLGDEGIPNGDVFRLLELEEASEPVVAFIVDGKVRCETVSYLNDTLRLDFATIADIIESNIEVKYV